MHTVISTARKAHYRLLANAQADLGNSVSIYTSTPRRMLKGFPELSHHFVPAMVTLLEVALRPRFKPTRLMNDLDSDSFDRLVALRLENADIVFGASTSTMYTARAAHRHGSKVVIDRACPDIRVQETRITEEAKKTGGTFIAAPKWFLQRQIDEYEEADFILSPSNYSASSFPAHLRQKTVIAPLLGRTAVVSSVEPRPANRPFTVGVIGGQPLRKGYLYLLEAWKQLGWTDARLVLRTSNAGLMDYPVLAELVNSQPTVSVVEYIPDLAGFFRECDAFILPSVDDGFGMAVYEAMGYGVPSILTKNCGSSELLTPDEDALVIEPFSAEAIRHALERLRDEADLRAKLAENGRRAMERLQIESTSIYRRGIAELMARAFPSAGPAAAAASVAHAG
jgi:glycosyltransferase involved in cell wall biosynthesis